MRALSHYWRVTRQDNVVAQALLEKAIAIIGMTARRSACSPLAICSARTWVGPTWRVCSGRQARRARGDRRRQRGPVGASCAWLRLHVRAAIRRIAGRVRDGAAAQPELFTGAGLSRLGAVRSRSGRGGTRGGEARAALNPRDPFSAVFYGIASNAKFVGRNYADAIAYRAPRSASAAICRRASRAHRRRRYGRRAMSPPPPCRNQARAAEHHARLDRKSEMPIGSDAERAHYLRCSPRRLGIASPSRQPACRRATHGPLPLHKRGRTPSSAALYKKDKRRIDPAKLESMIGEEVGISHWAILDQQKIDAFAELTLDPYFIHTHPARAKAETPFGGTIRMVSSRCRC